MWNLSDFIVSLSQICDALAPHDVSEKDISVGNMSERVLIFSMSQPETSTTDIEFPNAKKHKLNH